LTYKEEDLQAKERGQEENSILLQSRMARIQELIVLYNLQEKLKKES